MNRIIPLTLCLAAMIAAAGPAASEVYHSGVPGATLGDFMKMSRKERDAYFKGYFENVSVSFGTTCGILWFYKQDAAAA